MRPRIWFEGSTNRLRIAGARKVDDTWHDGTSSGSITLLDLSEIPLAGHAWPAALTYGGVPGSFYVDLPPTVQTGGAGSLFRFRLELLDALGRRYYDEGPVRSRYPSSP